MPDELTNEKLIELKRIINEDSPDAEEARRIFCNFIRYKVEKILNKRSIRYGKPYKYYLNSYLDIGIGVALLALCKKWNSEINVPYMAFFWMYVKNWINDEINKNEERLISIDQSTKENDDEARTLGDTVPAKELPIKYIDLGMRVAEIIYDQKYKNQKFIWLLAKGYSYREMEREFGINRRTLTSMLKNVMERLQNEMRSFFEMRNLDIDNETAIKMLKYLHCHNILKERSDNNEG